MKGDLLWVYEGLTQLSRLGVVDAHAASSRPTGGATIWRRRRRVDGHARRPQVASARRHRHRCAAAPSLDAGVAVVAPLQRLLPRGAALVARRRRRPFASARAAASRSTTSCTPSTADPTTAPRSSRTRSTTSSATLDSVVANDWRAFFAARVDEVEPRAPLGGITGGGWRLVYNDKPNERIKALGKEDKIENWSYSLGFTMKDDGMVSDVIPGTPAHKAGLGPAMRVLGVDGRKLGKDVDRRRAQARRGTHRAARHQQRLLQDPEDRLSRRRQESAPRARAGQERSIASDRAPASDVDLADEIGRDVAASVT